MKAKEADPHADQYLHTMRARSKSGESQAFYEAAGLKERRRIGQLGRAVFC